MPSVAKGISRNPFCPYFPTLLKSMGHSGFFYFILDQEFQLPRLFCHQNDFQINQLYQKFAKRTNIMINAMNIGNISVQRKLFKDNPKYEKNGLESTHTFLLRIPHKTLHFICKL